MHLIISSSSENQSKILNAVKSSRAPIFLCFRKYEDVEKEGLGSCSILPEAAIIDECENIGNTKDLCNKLKALYPSLKVGVILSKERSALSLFRHIPEADEEIFSPLSSKAFIDFLQKLCPTRIPSVSPSLICTPKASYLLGYDMKLSPGENRIMIFLSIFNNLKLNANTICELCLNIPEDRISTVRVLINRINKKARNISSRNVILNSYKNGYYINPEA